MDKKPEANIALMQLWYFFAKVTAVVVIGVII